MFYDFLKQYIKDYIDCSDENYDITDDEIKDIAEDVSNNDYVWEIIDEAINQELWRYKEEEDE